MCVSVVPFPCFSSRSLRLFSLCLVCPSCCLNERRGRVCVCVRVCLFNQKPRPRSTSTPKFHRATFAWVAHGRHCHRMKYRPANNHHTSDVFLHQLPGCIPKWIPRARMLQKTYKIFPKWLTKLWRSTNSRVLGPVREGNREGAAITTRLTTLPNGQGVGGFIDCYRSYCWLKVRAVC